MATTELDRKLQAQLLGARRLEGDRLMLADAVLLAALDGTRPLTGAERAALQASPLTARRLRVLATERRQASRRERPGWQGSAGMLRAADGGAPLAVLVTDDGAWRLHIVEGQVILQLDAQSALAPQLLRSGQVLRVRDGAGAIVLEGQLDSDGECEGRWPFAEAPSRHFQRHGGAFTVEPAGA
ncbi:hypothetical protein [Massilia sp. H6]|uniref:hypothetical protein n=1 Tax=Massilia sp. H6 TaxID=2970464 RepID=UPI00216A4D6C|nr:hypothetical protein [Massilia sp. H6]UVW26899.1 hypothetical protein NRS07_09925 [Massilia sp. H6]